MTRQGFKTVDLLRLEVEDDATGLVNLVRNPNGELGGWGWITPVSGTSMDTFSVGGVLRGLQYYSPPVSAPSYFYTEPLTVAAGQYVAASWRMIAPSGGWYRAQVEWLHADGTTIAATVQTVPLQASDDTITHGAFLAPATTVAARLRFAHYSTESGVDPVPNDRLILREATVVKAAAPAALVQSRINLVTNPSFETNGNSWAPQENSGITIIPTNSQASVGTKSLGLITGLGVSAIESTTMPVTGGATYALRMQVRAYVVERRIQAYVEWIDNGGNIIGSAAQVGTGVIASRTAWTGLAGTVSAPPSAHSCRVLVYFDTTTRNEVFYLDAIALERTETGTVPAYFDGATPAAGGYTYGWTGTPHASASTATKSSLGFIAPVPYVNVLGPTLQIGLNRDELNVSILSADILDSSIDPSQSSLVRPGKAVRLLAYDGVTWQIVFTGTLRTGSVTYDLKQQRADRQVRVQITASDNATALANSQRPQGVGTIDELPFVLEGAGVPWNINGSGAQVPTAAVVATNQNATALDQVAITRDTQQGYAWVDRFGVVQAWDRDRISTTVRQSLAEVDYTDLSVTYDLDDVINEVNVKLLRPNLATGETVEVPYGPFRDQASIDVYGVHSAEFTLQGLPDTDTAMATYAAAVLTARATPMVRINTVKLALATETDVAGKGLLDLYDLVTVVNADKDLDQDLRITGIEHAISPKKWLVTLTFSRTGSVATPTKAPPVQSQPTVLPARFSNEFVAAVPDVGAGQGTGDITVTHSLGTTPSVVVGHLEDGAWAYQLGWLVSARTPTTVSFKFWNNGPSGPASANLRFRLIY